MSVSAAAAGAAPLMRDTKTKLALLAVLAQTTIAVATSFVAKWTLQVIPAMPLTLIRMAGALVVMTTIVLVRGERPWRLPRQDLMSMAVLGLFGMTLNQACFLRGLAETTPSHSALLYAMTPLVVLLIARARGIERLTRFKLAGLLCAFTGVAVVLLEKLELSRTQIRGDVIIVFGVLSWAAYSALGKPVLQRYDTVTVTTVCLFFGTLFLLPLSLPETLTADYSRVSLAVWLGIAYMIVFASVLAYLFWYYAIQNLPPSRVAVFMNLQPPAVVLVSWLWLEEPISAAFLVGAALVLAGVRLAGSGR